MKVFFDTEFNEDGTTIDLISIGMVKENGDEYYAVNLSADWERVYENEWLLKNVVDKLDYSYAKPKSQIRNEVSEFLHTANPVELWAWYGAYDHVALAQLFGKMMDLPDHIPMYTNDLKQEVDRLKVGVPYQPSGNHNALEDARFLKVRYDAVFGENNG